MEWFLGVRNIMYKKTQNALSYLNRSASHSTKPPLHEPQWHKNPEDALRSISQLSLAEARDLRLDILFRLEREREKLAAAKESGKDQKKILHIGVKISQIEYNLSALKRRIAFLDAKAQQENRISLIERAIQEICPRDIQTRITERIGFYEDQIRDHGALPTFKPEKRSLDA